jgi:hypothetical protein
MSLNQQVIAEFSPCTPSAPQLRDLSIQTFRPSGKSPTGNQPNTTAFIGTVRAGACISPSQSKLNEC